MDDGLAHVVQGRRRFVPHATRGELTEAQRLCRYWWAAQFAEGRRVLDAGCGLGYGSSILARAGASAVVGVEAAEPVVEAARATVSGSSTVAVRGAELRALPFHPGEFDVVVCFDAFEEADDQAAVLDELVRVTGPAGVLLLSARNPAQHLSENGHR